MNEHDIRVIKTKESIEAALLELLAQKPLNKVTVTELARVARINKGTFYRHYLDIYDLHDQAVQRGLDQVVAQAQFLRTSLTIPSGLCVSSTRSLWRACSVCASF